MASDPSLRESGACVHIQVLPLALEYFEVGTALQHTGIVLSNSLHRQVRFEAATPLAEGPWVVCSMVFDTLERKPSSCADVGTLNKGRGRRKAGVWPHVLAHEVFRSENRKRY